jgi:hypothetical protein
MVCRTSRGLSCSSFWIWIWTDHVTWRCVSCCAGTTRCVSSMCFQNSRGTQGARKFKWNFTGGKKRAIRRHEKLQIPKPSEPHTHDISIGTRQPQLATNLHDTCTFSFSFVPLHTTPFSFRSFAQRRHPHNQV